MCIVVTGGSGFIGANFILDWLQSEPWRIINIDKRNDEKNLGTLSGNKLYQFIKADISDSKTLSETLKSVRPRVVVNFAAESHVDRAIENPKPFIDSNVVGTYQLLQSSLTYWDKLSVEEKTEFVFVHISTDEVFGSLSKYDMPFSEGSNYAPNNPYSASKAASDHLVRAYNKTYNFPTIITHCSNNYGPYQLPEKLIPLIISNCLMEKAIPVYGNGRQIRDWVFVNDHCAAIKLIIKKGERGKTYNIGGGGECTNLKIVHNICSILDNLKPSETGKSYASLITHVKDRPGHDTRYAINNTKIQSELGWFPSSDLTTGLKKTVEWYLNNENWLLSNLKK